MMGTAATGNAATRRAEFREAQRAMKLAKQQAKIDAFIARQQAKTDKIETKSAIEIARQETERDVLLTPIQQQGELDAVDTDARVKLVKALPWIIGGIVVIGGAVFLRRKKG